MIRSRRHFHGFEPLAGIPGNRDALQAGEAAKLGVQQGIIETQAPPAAKDIFDILVDPAILSAGFLVVGDVVSQPGIQAAGLFPLVFGGFGQVAYQLGQGVEQGVRCPAGVAVDGLILRLGGKDS